MVAISAIVPANCNFIVGKINVGGTLITQKGNSNVTLVSDSIIVPIILYESVLNNSLDNYIDNINKLKIKLPYKHAGINDLGTRAEK